jgi:hypothetical protein
MTRKPKKRTAFEVPEIVEGMCGTCTFWAVSEGEEDGSCRMLAIAHQRGDRSKRRYKRFVPEEAGPLVRAVREREWAFTDGWYWTETGSGEVVASEIYSELPRFYLDDESRKVWIWSPLRTYGWFGCSRYQSRSTQQSGGVEQ